MKYSQLRGKQLEELIEYITNAELMYRNNLGIDELVSFGVEIEYERALRQIVETYIKYKFPKWHSQDDTSLTLGGEITSPVMRDEEKLWQELKAICTFLKRLNVITNNNAAGHIHVGSQILGNDLKSWRKFTKTYAIYEDILFRFLYGEMKRGRKKIKQYAAPISGMIVDSMDKINSAETPQELIRLLPLYEKEKAINFTNIDIYDITREKYKNTIEFRMPNGTVNEIVWQNNINAIIKFLLAQKNIDEEFLDYQIANGNLPSPITYEEICLKRAIELVDLIFEKDIDKLYFMQQYLKQKSSSQKTLKFKN